MKYFFCVCFLGLAIGFSAHPTKAQNDLSNEQISRYQAELKSLGRPPERFKYFKDSVNSMGAVLDSMALKVKQINDKNIKQQEVLSSQRLKVNELYAELERLRNQKPTKNGTPPPNQRNIFFKIQIAAFKKESKLGNFLDKNSKFVRSEVDEADGMRKYTIANFINYWEAKQLERYLLDKGAQVFIVGYEDGKRVNDIKKLLEGTF
ncbi:MAG TPA: hypothetical protein DCM08_10830 [Microscillaceae bacterium]|jgi:hypothetical protein|nr:hypothetical protein [Microscillaceae bacterium]